MKIGITAFLNDTTIDPSKWAIEVERRGFYSLYLPEHTHMPVDDDMPPSVVEGVDPQSYKRSLDPYVALAAAGAVTSRLRLGTGVSLVAQHDPIVLAKQVATIDHMSGGRFVLGIGFGWNRREAADHGIDFDSRRAIATRKSPLHEGDLVARPSRIRRRVRSPPTELVVAEARAATRNPDTDRRRCRSVDVLGHRGVRRRLDADWRSGHLDFVVGASPQVRRAGPRSRRAACRAIRLCADGRQARASRELGLHRSGAEGAIRGKFGDASTTWTISRFT